MLRQSKPGEPRIHVIARACVEVARPILFAISIIIVVFLPLFTLQGVEGKTFKPLAYTVSLAMLGSLVFAIFLAPVLSDIFMRRPKKIKSESDNGDNFVVRLLLRIYKPMIVFFVRRRGAAIALAAALILIGTAIFPRLGSEFTPTLQEGSSVLRLTMAPSISLPV